MSAGWSYHVYHKIPAYLVVNTFVEENAERPPIRTHIVTLTSVHFGREISECARLAGQYSSGNNIRSDILLPVSALCIQGGGVLNTYKIRQMHMAICIEKDIVWLDIAVNDVVSVDIPQSAGQFSYPEANCLFSKCFPRNMKAEVSAAHQIDNQIPMCCVSSGIWQG